MVKRQMHNLALTTYARAPDLLPFQKPVLVNSQPKAHSSLYQMFLLFLFFPFFFFFFRAAHGSSQAKVELELQLLA